MSSSFIPHPSSFSGFSGKSRSTPLPAAFFAEIMPFVTEISELKVILYAFWLLDRQEGTVRYLREEDMSRDERLLAGFGETEEAARQALAKGLALAVEHRVLLRSESDAPLYFLNSPRGRAALRAYQQGDWSPEDEPHLPPRLTAERPNIFRLYEQNIGALTPLIGEMLEDAEKTYPADWIADAIRIAVKKNVRNWRFVEAILKSWQEKGRDETTRRDTEKDRRRYIEGEYSDFIER